MKVGSELGNYVVDDEIGRGSFGVVYRAHNKRYAEMQRAIKVLRAGAEHEPELIRLFEREAAILQSIDSPNVCRIFDYGQTDDGRPYIAMELLAGETLADIVKRGPLPVDVALDYVAQICAGLAEVHRHGIVHRDVKPANVFVTQRPDGTPLLKLLDFNIAKLVRPEVGTTLSGAEAGPGTDHYMSPEQITAPQTVDATTDVWAVGAVLFELVAGVPPFRGESSGAIKVAIVTGDRRELPEHAAAVAPTLAKCLVERGQRIASIEALGAELRRTPAQSTTPARPIALATDKRDVHVGVLDTIASQWLLIAIGLLALGLALLLGSFAIHPELNEFVQGTKRIGYTSSFNCTVVHTFLSPIELALVARLIARADALAGQLGPHVLDDWRRRARRVTLLWLALTVLFALGYTLIEWRPFLSGDCDGGTFLGWPNRLCAVTRSPASIVFMVIAMLAQVAVMSVGWLLFSVIVWLCDLLFGRNAVVRLRAEHAPQVLGVFGSALWAWLVLYGALFLARLWSFHLQTPDTAGIVETVVWHLPDSLFDLDLHTQPDMGSIISATVLVVAALAPFVLLRLRVGVAFPPLYRRASVFGVIALLACTFPRLGVFLFLLFVLATLVTPRAQGAMRGWLDRR